jgi:Fic family protein
MRKRLSTTNPYLKNPAARERSVRRSVETSSAIEGIRAPLKRPIKASNNLKPRGKGKR